eukprot:8495422-Pyramimonas_sp.AAC.1
MCIRDSSLAPRTFALNICKSFTGSWRSEFHWFSRLARQKWCSGTVLDCHGSTVLSIGGVEIPGMVFWYDSGSPRHNSEVHSWRPSPENGVLTRFKMFTTLFSMEQFP